MARRTSRSRRRASGELVVGLSALLGRRSRRVSGMGLALVLGAWLLGLDAASWLPEPAATLVREAEAWLEPVLGEFGREPASGQGGTTTPPSVTSASDEAAVVQALALLDRIAVAPERSGGYLREDWPHWLDRDGDCRDARQEALATESLEPVRWSAEGCDVAEGLWRDLYTGETFRDPHALDMDHFVPLAEAHRSGGHAWSRERRAAFANDLEDSRALIAVSASANRAKGDQGPEEWLPPEEAHHCRYAADWVAVKLRWSLAMDERERVTVGNLLRACAGG